jgi:hypothetical protein
MPRLGRFAPQSGAGEWRNPVEPLLDARLSSLSFITKLENLLLVSS